MKVAVITPIYNCPQAWFEKCVQSVAQQSYPCHHIIVNDGDQTEIFAPLSEKPTITLINLPHTHHNVGSTPRAIGAISAFTLGYDAVCWLDADNWYAPNHVESLVTLHKQTNAPFCTSDRYLCHLNGNLLGKCPETNPKHFIDANCYFVSKEAKHVVNVWWMMADNLHPISDRVIMKYIKSHHIPHQHTYMRTVYYRTAYQAHYDYFGLPYPEGSKPNPVM